jgi:hypothetical protein
MVLPLVEDVLRSLVLREAAVFASSAAQSSGLPTWQQVGMEFGPPRACALSVDDWPDMESERKRLLRRCSRRSSSATTVSELVPREGGGLT